MAINDTSTGSAKEQRMTKRRITILGMGGSAYERRHDIADYCKGTEIWSLNNAYLTFPKLARDKSFSRFFEMHSASYLETWEAGKTKDGKKVNHFSALHQLETPVYCMEPLPKVSRQVVMSFKDLAKYWYERLFDRVENIGELETERLAMYFQGSPSLMLAIALKEHDEGKEIEHIQSWGIDTRDPSHLNQRAAWSFWISQAMARGISIGGTACAFMFEPEQDAGLDGLQNIMTQHTIKR